MLDPLKLKYCKEDVRIRPLRREDAYTSVNWRNDSEVFKYTGNVYSHPISLESELEWIDRVMSCSSDHRFAIEVKNKYVGNIYLTDVSEGKGHYHIFIGEKEYWGKGVAEVASISLLNYAFGALALEVVELNVNVENKSALALYRKLGFTESETNNLHKKMILTKERFLSIKMNEVKENTSADSDNIPSLGKRYIFLTNTIGNVGGGQLYLSTKVGWLEKEGWKVDVYYFERNPIVLENLIKYKKNYIRDFEFRFSSLSEKERKEIIDEIIENPDLYKSIVIESYSFETGLWGEYIARNIGGKHICYLLTETHYTVTNSMKKFLEFKLKQRLLYGITPHNIPALLPGSDGYSTFLSAVGCSSRNAPDIDDERLNDIPDKGFVILSIGRLEKPYMPSLFREVIEFAKTSDELVCFVIVGDSPKTIIRKNLEKMVGNSSNLLCLFWGYTFPIPKKLYERADVFVGCAGSSNMAFKERVPTITIDAADYMAIGILGETTKNRLYRADNEPPIPVRTLLSQIESECNKRRSERAGLSPIVEHPDFSAHAEIIDAPFDREYYPVESVKNMPLFDFVYKTIKRIGGKRFLYFLKKIKQKIK